MTLVSRAQWGARSPKSSTAISLPVRGIAAHYEGPTVGSMAHDKCDARVRGIQNFHMNTRGWADIAYNFLVCQHGYVYVGRGLGVRSAAQGTNEGNADYIAICVIIGVGDVLSNAAKLAFAQTVALVRKADGGVEVRPHSSFHSTSCPGDSIRGWINAGMPVGDIPGPISPPKASTQVVLAKAPKPAPKAIAPAFPGQVLVNRTVSENARVWQQKMKDRGWNITVDGDYGAKSALICKSFQREKHLTEDGKVGKDTWLATWEAPAT